VSTATRVVFETAGRLGVQVRGLAVERESMEAAFLRVIGVDSGASTTEAKVR
jgi:hypothetical protein